MRVHWLILRRPVSPILAPRAWELLWSVAVITLAVTIGLKADYAILRLARGSAAHQIEKTAKLRRAQGVVENSLELSRFSERYGHV